MAGKARKTIEKERGTQIVSSKNYLTQEENSSELPEATID